VRVYYEDTDFSGGVYHASYLRFLERGRTEFLRALGIEHRGIFGNGGAGGFHFVVRAMTIEFLKPALMDDVLCVETHFFRHWGRLDRYDSENPARRRSLFDRASQNSRCRGRQGEAHSGGGFGEAQGLGGCGALIVALKHNDNVVSNLDRG
jgi:YbgC/YbaW family acyl-CoA thioester hydrolase